MLRVFFLTDRVICRVKDPKWRQSDINRQTEWYRHSDMQVNRQSDTVKDSARHRGVGFLLDGQSDIQSNRQSDRQKKEYLKDC